MHKQQNMNSYKKTVPGYHIRKWDKIRRRALIVKS